MDGTARNPGAVVLRGVLSCAVLAGCAAASAGGGPDASGAGAAAAPEGGPPPPVPPGADLVQLSEAGEDVALHPVPGKATVFDFHADWCVPCRQVDAHLFPMLGPDSGVALRKINVVSWDSPVARAHLRDVPALPYVIVFGRDGRHVAAISGLDLPALDRALEEALR